MKVVKLVLKYIDELSEWSGKGIAWLGLLLILELVYDTIARYAFNAPTAWSYDISYMLYGAHFMVGAAYVLLIDEHIRVDVIYTKVSPKARTIIELIGYLVFFFPSIGALFYFGIPYTLKSWALLEHASISFWRPPIYPFKTVIPVAAFLLLVQGIAKFVRSLSFVVKRESLGL